MNDILNTTDFTIFKGHDNNRAIDQNYVKMLIGAIKNNNLLRFRPILVDKNMRVIDGQHRLCAAKSLDFPIYYQIKDDATENDIISLNIHQRIWKMEDWLNFYANLGNKHYIDMLKFSEEMDMSINSLFRIFQAVSKQFSFRGGKFKFPKHEKIETIKIALNLAKQIIEDVSPFLLGKEMIISKDKFLEGMTVLIIESPDMDLDHLKEKMIRHNFSIRLCASIDAYKRMLKDIYNYRRKQTI
jgi:hypothetical protein